MRIQKRVGPAANVGMAILLLARCRAEPAETPTPQGSSACAWQALDCAPMTTGGGSGTFADDAIGADPLGARSGVPTGASASESPLTLDEGSGAPAGAADVGVSSQGVATADSVPTDSGADTQAGASGPATGGPAPDPVQGPPMRATPTDAPSIPCAVASIVGERCTGCHGSEPTFGAPMPLTTLADFQAPARSDNGRKVFEVVAERIDPMDVARRMPPTSLPALDSEAKDALNAWIEGGALGVGGGCEITETSLTPDADAPATTASGSGGAHITPIEYDDPDMQCYKFVAHAAGGDRPYSAAPGEAYINFSFAAPWRGTVYQRAIKVVLDDKSRVIHHWLLFKLAGRGAAGAVAVGTGAHPDGILLHGWAPGASPVYLDKDVGVKLEGNVGYMLEVHYYNSGFTPGPDQSGAEICVTPTPPEHLAELSWLGTDAIVGTSASGSCSPNIREPVHLIVAQPHMHLKGRHMKVVINRRDRTQEVIHDEDFSFENQRYYVLNAILNPGETVTTTCRYNGVATFGTSTNSEMCYFFTLHWPAGALRTGGIGTVLHGANSCL